METGPINVHKSYGIVSSLSSDLGAFWIRVSRRDSCVYVAVVYLDYPGKSCIPSLILQNTVVLCMLSGRDSPGSGKPFSQVDQFSLWWHFRIIHWIHWKRWNHDGWKLRLTSDVFPNEPEGNLKGQGWNGLSGKAQTSDFRSEVELHWAIIKQQYKWKYYALIIVVK